MTSNQTIAEQVVAFQQEMASQAPAEILAGFTAEQAALTAAGVPDGIPEPGSAMPDAKLLDVHGAATTLSETRQGRPAVVVFYRGAWCPYCNVALRTYEQQVAPALAERGIALIAVSPQKPDGSLTMRESGELTYDVVSDPGNQIAAKLGILTAPDPASQEARTEMGLDLTALNADGTDTIPMPTTVLVAADGTIRWIDVHPNYATRTEPQEILDAVAALG